MVGLCIAATTVIPVPQPEQSRLIANAKTTIFARNFSPNQILGREAPLRAVDENMVRIPVGSVHQPEPEDSSRVGCRQKSRRGTADTTCLRLPCVDFSAVCRPTTLRLAGLKNSATKDIPYIGSFQQTHAHLDPRFQTTALPLRAERTKLGHTCFASDPLVIQRQSAVVF
jgi:hypothetical protein